MISQSNHESSSNDKKSRSGDLNTNESSSRQIIQYNFLQSEKKKWHEDITSDEAITSVDAENGLWLHCKFCNKKVPSRLGKPFTK